MTTPLQFQVADKVWLNYPTAPRRAASVREVHEDGTITVTWQTWTQDRTRPHRRRAGYEGPIHLQRVTTGRLTARSV